MRRAAIVGLAIGVVAVVSTGVGLAVWAAADRTPDASDVAMTYFSALASGDAAGALAVTALSDAERRLAAEAYTGVTERVGSARVASVTGEADSSRVVVSYSLAGTDHEAALALVRDADGWRIVDGVAEITPLTSLGDAVGFGGVVAPAGTAIALLPGRYEAEALPRGLVAGTATVDAAPGTETDVTVTASVSPDATEAAQSQLDAYVDACTAPATVVPANCGLRVPWAADLASASSFAFRIDERPAVSLSPDGRSFAATGGIVVATVAGTTREGTPASFTYRADDWALRGTVSFRGNEMVLSVG